MSDELRSSYKHAVSRLDWEAMAGVFAARRWVYGGFGVPAIAPNANDLRKCTDELFDACLRQLEGGVAEPWCLSGRMKVSIESGAVVIDGQAIVYRDGAGPTDAFAERS